MIGVRGIQKIVQTLVMCLLLSGCTTTAKLGTTGVVSAIGAAVAGPVGAVGGAVAGDLISEVVVEPIMSIGKKAKVVEEKVDSVWSLLARLGEVAGWVVAAIIIVPLLIPLLVGYIIPSPGDRRRRKK